MDFPRDHHEPPRGRRGHRCHLPDPTVPADGWPAPPAPEHAVPATIHIGQISGHDSGPYPQVTAPGDKIWSATLASWPAVRRSGLSSYRVNRSDVSASG